MIASTQNGAVLTTHEATVQTAQVEIQVLKVGKKQVTMGLFRQLPLQPLLHRTTLVRQGNAWGHVNYWWVEDGSPPSSGTRLHVVWEAGGALYRDIVTKEPEWRYRNAWRLREEALMTNLFLAWLATAGTEEVIEQWSSIHQGAITIDGKALHVAIPDECRGVVQRYEARLAAPGAHSHDVNDIDQAYRDLLQSRDLLGKSQEQLYGEVESHQVKVQRYRERWEAEWTALSLLPQLFIAV